MSSELENRRLDKFSGHLFILCQIIVERLEEIHCLGSLLMKHCLYGGKHVRVYCVDGWRVSKHYQYSTYHSTDEKKITAFKNLALFDLRSARFSPKLVAYLSGLYFPWIGQIDDMPPQSKTITFHSSVRLIIIHVTQQNLLRIIIVESSLNTPPLWHSSL